jgi:hypothetical protein
MLILLTLLPVKTIAAGGEWDSYIITGYIRSYYLHPPFYRLAVHFLFFDDIRNTRYASRHLSCVLLPFFQLVRKS